MIKRISRLSIFELRCRCGNKLLEYKKKTAVIPKYCYLGQITYPDPVIEFKYDPCENNPDRARLLVCRECHKMIGRPVCRKGKLAFQLRIDFFSQKKIIS